LATIDPVAREAAPALVKALRDDNEEIAPWAALALVRIGPEVAPLLEEALPSADADSRSRCEEILSCLGPLVSRGGQRTARLNRVRRQALERINQMKTLYVIRRAFKDGKPSLNAVARELEKRADEGRLDDGIPRSQSRLTRTQQELAQQLFGLDELKCLSETRGVNLDSCAAKREGAARSALPGKLRVIWRRSS